MAGRADLGGWSHLGSARAFVLAGDFDAAAVALFNRHLSEAARLFAQAGDDGAALETGLVDLERYWASGQLSVMLERGTALVERARHLGDRPREMLILARLVGAAAMSARSAVAAEYLGKADALAASLGLRIPLWGRISRCALHTVRGDLSAAIACQNSLYADAVAERDPILEITSLRNRGENLLERDRFDEARPFLEQALGQSVRMAELWSRTELTASLAVVAAALGETARADELIRDARALVRNTDRYAVAFTSYSAARVHELASRVADAENAYRQALTVMESTEYLVPGSWMRLRFAEFLLKVGRPLDARREFEATEPLLRATVGEIGDRVTSLRNALASARTAH